MFDIYWLISEDSAKTYIGYTNDLKRRIVEHKRGDTKSTKEFGNFRCLRIEKMLRLEEARKRERYWKSAAGRKKLKNFYNKIKNNYGPIV